MLAVVFAIFVWPAFAIAGLVTLAKEIKRLIKGDSCEPPKNNVYYETRQEEERRINYYGKYDDEWGML